MLESFFPLLPFVTEEPRTGVPDLFPPSRETGGDGGAPGTVAGGESGGSEEAAGGDGTGEGTGGEGGTSSL